MGHFITVKRWRLKEDHTEDELFALVSGSIVPHYHLLSTTVRLGLGRIAETRSYLALQHWPSRAEWEATRQSELFTAWYRHYEPILERWDTLMEFEEEWENEELI
jgi:hypothetical protein